MDVLYIFHRWRDDVYRLAAGFTLNSREAEDVCQRVFLKLPEQSRLIPGREKNWLLEATVYECRRLLRFRWRRGEAETAWACGDPAEETLWLLRKLKPEYRVVLYLHYYEQYTTQEIARILNISTGTATARLNRGRKRLEPLLEGMKRRLPDAYERMMMSEACTRRIEGELEDHLRERQDRRHIAIAHERTDRGGWIAAAGLVCLVLALSVGGTFLFLKVSEKASVPASARIPQETMVLPVSSREG